MFKKNAENNKKFTIGSKFENDSTKIAKRIFVLKNSILWTSGEGFYQKVIGLSTLGFVRTSHSFNVIDQFHFLDEKKKYFKQQQKLIQIEASKRF